MIKLSLTTQENISQHALLDYPNECCGFLYGIESNGVREIVDNLRIVNSKIGDKSKRFEIAPNDYLNAEQYAINKGLTMLGIYHSHPNHPSSPSEHDRIAAQPFFSYVILSTTEFKIENIQSWLLNDDFVFEEEEVEYKKQINS